MVLLYSIILEGNLFYQGQNGDPSFSDQADLSFQVFVTPFRVRRDEVSLETSPTTFTLDAKEKTKINNSSAPTTRSHLATGPS